MTHIILIVCIAAAGIPLCAPLVAQAWRMTTPALAFEATEVGNHVATSPPHAIAQPFLLATEQNQKPTPKHHPWWWHAFIGASVVLLLGIIVGGALLIDGPAPQPVQAYLYVNPGHEVVYLQVQGALTSTTGTWLEADRTAHGIVRHEWTMQYQANDRTVHIVLHTPSLDLVVTGTIDNAQYSALSLTLPPNAVGLFPPTAHFHAATPGDWNSAYTSLVASVGVTP